MARHGIVVNGRRTVHHLEDDEGSIRNERPINRPGKSEYSLSMVVTVPKNKKRVMTNLNAELNQGTIRKSIKFEPGSSRFVSARLSQPLQEDKACYAIAADDLPEELHIQEALVLVNEKNEIDIHASNRSDQTIQLMRKTVVTHVEPVDVYALRSNDAEEIKDGCTIKNVCTIDGSKPNDTKYFEKFTLDQDSKALKKTLRKFKDIFVDKGEPTGKTDIVTHKINTGMNYPIRQRPYRTPLSQKAKVQEEIKEMLDQKVITPSKSPWAAPIVMVLKKDGEYRFCIDYRK
ncbi:MAG TPA: hypothetical protein VIO82_02065, partial [Candidatus Methylopumilus sp.]